MNSKLSRLIYLLPLPFLLNFLLNINNLKHLEITNFIFAFFCFIFLYFLGFQINKVFNFNSISFSIVFYLVTIFAINFAVLPLDKYFFSFKEIFYLTNLILIFYIFKKTKNIKYLVMTLLYLLLLRYSSNFLDYSNVYYIQYSSDVSKFWNPMTEKIYNKDLYFALRLNIFQGYSLMINYIFAELSFLFFGSKYFLFVQALPNVFFYLNLLIIKELNINRNLKILLSIMFCSIVLNSDWLSYLFLNSLMGEVVVNYVFSVFVVYVLINKNIKNETRFFVIFGFLYFLKPFASMLFILIPILIFIKNRKIYVILLSLIGFILNLLYSNYLISSKSEYNTNVIENSYFRILLENSEKLFDFNFLNFVDIFKEVILIDKILTLFLFFYITLKIIGTLKENNFNILTKLIFINFILVFYIYTTVWKSMEFGSSYRYLFSFFILYFIDMFETLNNLITSRDFQNKIKITNWNN